MITMCQHECRNAPYQLLNEEQSDSAKRVMRLDYCLHESEFDTVRNSELYSDSWDTSLQGHVISYGIGITKTDEDSLEEIYIGDVTSDGEKAQKILRLLADNLVTPCGLRDVLEDICTEM